jgi:hypothetical protein
MYCEWCGENTDLIKEYCFSCYYMGVLESMGYNGTFEAYENLVTDTDRTHSLTYVLDDTLYLFGRSSMLVN